MADLIYMGESEHVGVPPKLGMSKGTKVGIFIFILLLFVGMGVGAWFFIKSKESDSSPDTDDIDDTDDTDDIDDTDDTDDIDDTDDTVDTDDTDDTDDEVDDTPPPVHGGWSPWGSPSACNGAWGVETGIRATSRTCTNPVPSNGGDGCVGESGKVCACNRREPLADGESACPKSWDPNAEESIIAKLLSIF
jgi:hypothetical protein